MIIIFLLLFLLLIPQKCSSKSFKNSFKCLWRISFQIFHFFYSLTMRACHCWIYRPNSLWQLCQGQIRWLWKTVLASSSRVFWLSRLTMEGIVSCSYPNTGDTTAGYICSRIFPGSSGVITWSLRVNPANNV